MMLRLDESGYPIGATPGDGLGGLRLPAWPACSALPPFDKPSGSARRGGECLSTSWFWPTPPSSPHRPTGSRSSAIPECPSTARWDDTCYGRVGRSCTSTVRINTRGLPGDRHNVKKAQTIGPSWRHSGPLNHVDALESGRAGSGISCPRLCRSTAFRCGNVESIKRGQPKGTRLGVRLHHQGYGRGNNLYRPRKEPFI
jgi:hypothetical protein